MPKPALKIVSPDTQIRKVETPRRPRNAAVRTREYLTESEVERLIKGCGGNRWPHRDQTMILLAFRHGLRASEVCDLQWTQVDFEAATLAVTRAKHGTPSTHPLTRPGAAGAASPAPRGRRPIGVPVRVRARLADDGVQLPEAH
jgi:integrase